MALVQPRDLPWSWERSPGWRGQYDRMLRWRGRLHRGSGGDVEELFDYVFAFFAACYHLRDWLERDIPPTKPGLERLFATSSPLRLAADIANIAKHFDLTRPPRAGRQLSLAREYDPTRAWFGPESRLVVLSDGTKTDVLQLVADCETAWRAFLENHGLIQAAG